MTSTTAYFAMGCFWGVERLFWQTPGVTHTTVGYMGGHTANPTYQQVCYTDTGHAETVKVDFDPAVVTYEQLVQIFFNHHDPTQVNRQGNDVGDQYRSAIFTNDEEQFTIATQLTAAMDKVTRQQYGKPVVTEVSHPGDTFWRAEEYHQKYLKKNPAGYCALRRQGHDCPTL